MVTQCKHINNSVIVNLNYIYFRQKYVAGIFLLLSFNLEIPPNEESKSRVAWNFSLLFAYKCRLLITFANSLDPDQARQNVRPDLDPNCLAL